MNAKEAEARRRARFEPMGHTTGVIDVGAIDAQLGWRTATGADYSFTLDLRRRLPRRWGRS